METERAMETWRACWRRGVAPLLSDAGLLALADALAADDPRLAQGVTTRPPPVQGVWDWPVEEACPISFCGWRGDGLVSVAEVEEYFARVCAAIDQALGEPAACRWFLHYVDDTPRAEMRRELLAEVRREQDRRAGRERERGRGRVSV